MRAGAVLAAVTFLVSGGLVPATAGDQPAGGRSAVQHVAFSIDETVQAHVDGLGEGCPAFVGTIQEQRHDELAGVVLPDGTAHGRTTATSVTRLVPDDPSTVSYEGGYVLHEMGTYADGGADDWLETSTVHGTLLGSDGSTVRFTEVAHLTTVPDGTVQVAFDRMRCSG